jgi:hypothetical protein
VLHLWGIVLKERFEIKGKTFDFSSFDDRVELGKGLIDLLRKPAEQSSSSYGQSTDRRVYGFTF